MDRTRRGGGRGFGGLLVLLAALALLIQAAAPAPAMAKSGPVTVALCGEHGGTVTLDLPAPPSDPGPCDHCPGCVVVHAAPVATTSSFQPVRYGLAVATSVVAHHAAPAGHDARRHPPSRGPPAILNA